MPSACTMGRELLVELAMQIVRGVGERGVPVVRLTKHLEFLRNGLITSTVLLGIRVLGIAFVSTESYPE